MDNQQRPVATKEQVAISSFSSRVYGWMAMGLAFTATIAYLIFATGAYVTLLPLWWLWSIGLFGVALAINFAFAKISVPGAISLFLAYSGLEGLLFGSILPAFAATYGGDVIWTAFATAAVVFCIAMGYGLFTKADLTKFGKILHIALIGLVAITVLFMIVSFFIHMPLMNLIISYIGLAIFVGLTAYDAQMIRQFSYQVQDNSEIAQKLSLICALKMYVNLVMIFWYLLQIFASSSNRK